MTAAGPTLTSSRPPLRASQRDIPMRHRHDFYTLCPSCETRVTLPLAARLQAARHGTTCRCPSCSNEWNCIQEWIYRDSADRLLQQQSAAPAYGQQVPPAYVTPTVPHPAHTQGAVTMPRPHLLPTYQPPQRVQPPMPTAHQQMQPGVTLPPQQAPTSQPAPAPHAWSFERQPQSSMQSASPSPYGRRDD